MFSDVVVIWLDWIVERGGGDHFVYDNAHCYHFTECVMTGQCAANRLMNFQEHSVRIYHGKIIILLWKVMEFHFQTKP